MATREHSGSGVRSSYVGVATMLGVGLLIGGCAQVAVDGDKPELAVATETGATKTKADDAGKVDASGKPARKQSELEKATEYWGKKYNESPRDLAAALSYARNLKAMGEKSQAMAVLQQASMFHGNDKTLASEYGRLALDMGQVGVAQQMLEAADDPTKPDWRVVSARGTVLAKQGKYSEAIPFYERAHTLAMDQPSILNNLALAYTMNGEAPKAEALLRRAAEQGGQHEPKVRQNLALVLGLQGRYDEAKQIGGRDQPADSSANVDMIRQIVKVEPKAMPAPPREPQVAGWAATVTQAPPARK